MAISGRLLADVRRFPSGCSGLLEVDRVEARGVEGRTELQLPECPAPLLLWPVHQLAGLVITMASWISHWPGAQLLTGRPQMWVVALLVLGLLTWLLVVDPPGNRPARPRPRAVGRWFGDGGAV